MKKSAKTAWRGAALAGLATGAFFLFKDQGALFKKYQARLQARLSGPAPADGPAPAATPPPASGSASPSAANGHVRAVQASNPPPPDSGTNFTPQGDVHPPQA